ncbi:hypothetical protein RI129_010674 [Pyrocoelia pectoralis]|uniref:CHK kinase-like domain-containing protein n=1 Tax=Pyrocoelia pectoralis TaxID=417401 RepID=A0AAN7ZI59_9COLE
MSTAQTLITKDFLQSVLDAYFKRHVKITNFFTSNVVSTGENFCGQLSRIVVNYIIEDRDQNERLSMIAKISLEDETTASSLSAMRCFYNELGVYSEVLPAMYSLDYREKLAPKAIYISHNPKPTLLLEDLTPLGYKMQNRNDGLNVDHLLLAVKKLAYFHAASVAVYEKEPEKVTKYNTGMYYDNDVANYYISICFASLVEATQKITDLHKYGSKMECQKIKNKLFSSMKPSGTFNVLNHGDAWTNNCMFSYDSDGKPTDVLLLDFQFSAFSTPALDLHYLWVICTDVDTKTKHLGTVLSYYHRKLVKYMLKLQVKTVPPTINQLRSEFDRKAIFGFGAMLCTLPLFLGSKRSDATLIDFYRDGGPNTFRYSCFNNEKYIEHLKIMLPIYDNLGVFD